MGDNVIALEASLNMLAMVGLLVQGRLWKLGCAVIKDVLVQQKDSLSKLKILIISHILPIFSALRMECMGIVGSVLKVM